MLLNICLEWKTPEAVWLVHHHCRPHHLMFGFHETKKFKKTKTKRERTSYRRSVSAQLRAQASLDSESGFCQVWSTFLHSYRKCVCNLNLSPHGYKTASGSPGWCCLCCSVTLLSLLFHLTTLLLALLCIDLQTFLSSLYNLLSSCYYFSHLFNFIPYVCFLCVFFHHLFSSSSSSHEPVSMFRSLLLLFYLSCSSGISYFQSQTAVAGTPNRTRDACGSALTVATFK